MDVRYVKQVLRSAAAGSAILLAAAPGDAGVLCPVEPSRPHVSAAHAPNWGFNPTCWQKFPPVPSCDSAVGCATHPYSSGEQYAQHEMIYAPQSGLMVPDQSLMSQPLSVLPQSLGSQRYSGGIATPSPAAVVPNQNQPTPEVRTFQPAPMSLPPLPSPQPAEPVVPGQSSVLPNHLMFRADGRITAAATSLQQGSSRYGVRVPETSMAAQSVSAPGSGIPVRAISRSRTASPVSGGSRYGAQPGVANPTGTNLEPLRRTPSIPYQR